MQPQAGKCFERFLPGRTSASELLLRKNDILSNTRKEATCRRDLRKSKIFFYLNLVDSVRPALLKYI